MRRRFREAGLFVICILSIGSIALADDSWANFAGSYSQAQTFRILLVPGNSPGQYIGQVTHGKYYSLTGTVENGVLQGTVADQQRNQFDFVATLDGQTLDFSSGGGQHFKLTADGAVGQPPPPLAPEPAPAPAGPDTLPPTAQNIPSWLTPGTRLVYRMRTALIPQRQYEQMPDPGALVQSPVDILAQGTDGFNLTDVLAIAGPRALALSRSSYLILGLDSNGQPRLNMTPTFYQRCIVPLGQMNIVDPAALASIQDRHTPTSTISHGTFKVGDKTFNTISFVYRLNQFYVAETFDLNTGLCLHNGGTSQSAAPPTPPGQPTSNVPYVLIGLSDLVGVRQVQTPWSASPIPEQMQGIHCMVYQGVQQTQLPKQKNMMNLVLKFHDSTDSYLQYTQYAMTQFPGLGGNGPGLFLIPLISELATAPTALAPYAIDPATLAKLQTGQSIDEDPILRYKTSVVFMGQDNQGRNIVVLSQISTGNLQNARTDWMYDAATGLMTELKVTGPAAVAQLALTAKN